VKGRGAECAASAWSMASNLCVICNVDALCMKGLRGSREGCTRRTLQHWPVAVQRARHGKGLLLAEEYAPPGTARGWLSRQWVGLRAAYERAARSRDLRDAGTIRHMRKSSMPLCTQ